MNRLYASSLIALATLVPLFPMIVSIIVTHSTELASTLAPLLVWRPSLFAPPAEEADAILVGPEVEVDSVAILLGPEVALGAVAILACPFEPDVDGAAAAILACLGREKPDMAWSAILIFSGFILEPWVTGGLCGGVSGMTSGLNSGPVQVFLASCAMDGDSGLEGEPGERGRLTGVPILGVLNFPRTVHLASGVSVSSGLGLFSVSAYVDLRLAILMDFLEL